MANTVVICNLPTGLSSPVIKLADAGTPDTLVNGSGDTLTEQSNIKSFYTATVTESLSGLHIATMEDSSGNVLATGYVTLADDTNTYHVTERVLLTSGTGDAQISLSSGLLAGIAGTLNTLDDLDTAQDTQHSTTQGKVDTVDTVADGIKAVTDNLPDSGALSSLATAAALATVDDNVDLILADTNELQTDWANGGRLDLILDARASQTTADAIETDTQDLQAQIGTAGDGLTGVPWNASWDAEVQSEVADGLAAYNAVATTDLPANFGDLSVTETTGRVTIGSVVADAITASALAADAVTEIQSGLATATALADVPTVTEFEARTIAAADYFDPAADTVTNVTLVGTCTTNTDMRGTDSAYTGTPPTAGSIADAVCDEALSGHTDAGSLAKALSDTLADTDELQTNQGDWATATGFSTHSAADVADAVLDEATSGHTTAGTVGKLLADMLADTTSLNDTVLAEITGASDIPATPTIRQAMTLMYMHMRNNTESTATERRVKNDAGTVVLEGEVADDGTTFTQGKLGDPD